MIVFAQHDNTAMKVRIANSVFTNHAVSSLLAHILGRQGTPVFEPLILNKLSQQQKTKLMFVTLPTSTAPFLPNQLSCKLAMFNWMLANRLN